MIGYFVAYTTSKPGPGYVATVLAASGAYPNIAILAAWAGGNAGGGMKRGVALALVIGLGNLGGCVIHLGPKLWEWGAHMSTVTPQHMCFIHILSTAAVSYGSRHGNRLPWYEVCTDTSSRGRNKSFSSNNGQYRMQLHHDVDIQEAK